jgi:hypothetical protein
MPADLTKPFAPSCCDGGECGLNEMSAQSCGCDKGAKWVCERHRREVEEATVMLPVKPSTTLLEVKLVGGRPYVSIPVATLTGSLDTKEQALFLIQRLFNSDVKESLMKLVEEVAFSPDGRVNVQVTL